MTLSSTERMDLSPCLMPWFASLLWVQLGMACCLTAMVIIIFVLLHWALPNDEKPSSPLTSLTRFPTTAKPSFPSKSLSHTSCYSKIFNPALPIVSQRDALPYGTSVLSTTTTTTSNVSLSTTSRGSLPTTHTSHSNPPSITTLQGITPFLTNSQTGLSTSTSPSTKVTADENTNFGAELTFSGRSDSGSRHLTLLSASSEGRPSSSLSVLKSRIREMLTKVREIDARVLQRDEVLVRKISVEDSVPKNLEEEELT